MRSYDIRITKRALKDIRALSPKMKKKLKDLLTEVLSSNPYEGKKLSGDLEGNYALRLNVRDRIVYGIDETTKTVYVKRAKTHYGG